jgi:Sec-independent protein translocase protein TatA
MDVSGSGGIGAVSAGFGELLIPLVVVLVVGFGVFKLAKLLWAALNG